MIEASELNAILRPWLGEAFLSEFKEDLAQMAVRMRLCVRGQESFEELFSWLDDKLLMGVRNRTRAKMVIRLDSGYEVRLRVSDFSQMADELMYCVFCRLKRTHMTFETLNEYSLRHSSLSSLRALYVDFQEFLTGEERKVIKRVITGNYPLFRWAAWLDTESGM